VFTSAGFQAASLQDPWTILACWVVGGLLALCGAATYAELGSLIPKAGGEYAYLREAYHPALGFISGWVSMTAGFSAPIATAALAFASYTHALAPELGDARVVAVALIVAVTVLHAFDTNVGGAVQAVFTAAKVVLITLFIVAGLAVGLGDTQHLATPSAMGLTRIASGDFAVSLMYVTFAYSGWNAAAYIADDVRSPQRNLPRALLLGTAIVTVLYVLLNLVFLLAVPTASLARGADGGPVIEVGDVAARALFGEQAGQAVSAIIALALVSSVSAMIMAAPRVLSAMAADGALPQMLARYSARGVPLPAVLAQGGLAVAFVLVGDLGALIRFVGFTLSLVAALTVGAVFILRRRGLRAAYRTPGYPVTPLLFIALSLWIAFAQVRAQPVESAWVLLVLAVGGALYALRGRARTG
jgi:APA family basic amino acid/polyamine antiporter